MSVSNVIINYDENAPLNGAFTYLQTKFNKTNINDGIVRISASTTVQSLEHPVVRRDIGIGDYWYSDDVNGSWYEVDFIQNNFYLESYVLRAADRDFFSRWQVLGSDDNVHYDVVDDVIDFQKPSVEYSCIRFVCKYPKTRRSFRIVTYGKKFGSNSFKFYLYRLEFYGRFVSKRNRLLSCYCRRRVSYLSIHLVSLTISR